MYVHELSSERNSLQLLLTHDIVALCQLTWKQRGNNVDTHRDCEAYSSFLVIDMRKKSCEKIKAITRWERTDLKTVSVLLEVIVNEARTRVYVPRGNFRWWKLQNEHSRHWVAGCVDMIRAFCIEPARILRKLNILKITARRKSSIAEDVDDSVCQCLRARRESHHNNTTIRYGVRDVATEDRRERRE